MARHTLMAMFAALLAAASAGAGELPDPAKIKPVELFRTPDPCDTILFGHAPTSFNGFVNSGKRVIRFAADGTKRRDWFDCDAPAGHVQMSTGHALIDADLKAIRWVTDEGADIRKISTGTPERPFRAPKGLALYLERKGLILGGELYVSDPGDSSADKPTGVIYLVNNWHKTQVVAEGLAHPHGMVLSIDAKTLYVAERDRNRILAFPVNGHVPATRTAGVLGKPAAVFAELPKKDPAKGRFDNQPCGLCLDAAGNLYVAHAGMGQVQVLNPKGKLIRSYDAGMPWPTSVAFRGLPVPHDSLFVAGATGERRDGGAVFRLDLGVEGLDMTEDTF